MQLTSGKQTVSVKAKTEKLAPGIGWYSLYFVLAVLDVITVLISFSLNVKLTREYEQSIAANTVWANRLANYAELDILMSAVNAPGNDVFDSQNVADERKKMQQAFVVFTKQLGTHRQEIESLRSPDTELLLTDFDTVDNAVKDMVREAELIFSYFEQHQAAMAAQRMATMDRKFAIAGTELARLSQKVRIIQKTIFDEQLHLATSLRKIEYIVLALVSVMIIGALFYGRYVSKVMQSAEADRMRIDKMKKEFISTVSHELRTPLTSISGSLRILLSGSLGDISPEPAKKMLEIAYKNSLRLGLLVNDLLDFEKITSGKLTFDIKSHSVISLVDDAIEASKSYWSERNVNLRFNRPEQDFIIDVDGSRLTQVLLNFISNAIKFSLENGEVIISVEQKVNSIRINVKDYGEGIPDSFKSKIFEQFSQADSSDTRKKGGTGLGLSISKALIEGMGGNIGFESQEGQGALFYVDISNESLC